MDILCFSHLRWGFVYQRPQHLMSRFVPDYRVYFIEEPVHHAGPDGLSLYIAQENLFVITPKLNNEVSQSNEEVRFKRQGLI